MYMFDLILLSSFPDDENPSIADIPADILQSTDADSSTAEVTWSEPTASDNSGAVTLTSSHNPGSNFTIGDTVVTYTAVDDSSNSVTATFTITVEGIFKFHSHDLKLLVVGLKLELELSRVHE